MATSLQVYREPAPETPPVFCKDCRHRHNNRGEPWWSDECKVDDTFTTCPVTGTKSLRSTRTRCRDRNASLACPDFSPLPPAPEVPAPRSWWSRLWGRR